MQNPNPTGPGQDVDEDQPKGGEKRDPETGQPRRDKEEPRDPKRP